jgi:hypothetical protein
MARCLLSSAWSAVIVMPTIVWPPAQRFQCRI